MSSIIVDRRVRKTKKALRDGLATLIAQKNIKDITVHELTDLVDLHRGTFYLHYRDIYDLYEQIEKDIVNEINEILDSFSSQNLVNSPFPIILSMIEYIADNYKMCQALLSNNSDMLFLEQLSEIIRQKCLHNMMEIYCGTDTEKYEYYVTYHVNGCIGIIREWVMNGMKQPSKHIAEMIEQMGLHGMGFLR